MFVEMEIMRKMPEATEKPDSKKPPLGLKPRYVHDMERFVEIADAIHRYIAAGKSIPDEWVEELSNIAWAYTAN